MAIKSPRKRCNSHAIYLVGADIGLLKYLSYSCIAFLSSPSQRCAPPDIPLTFCIKQWRHKLVDPEVHGVIQHTEAIGVARH